MALPKAAIFDNDGLLLDTEQAWTRAEVRLFAKYRRTFTLEHKRTLIGSSRASAAMKLEAMLDMAGGGEALMDELHKLVMEEALVGVEPRPGAISLLESLQEADVPLALASILLARVRRADAPVRRSAAWGPLPGDRLRRGRRRAQAGP